MSPYAWDVVSLTAASRVWGSIPKQSGKFAIFLSVFCYFSTSGKIHDWMDWPCFLALEANFKGWLPSVCQSLMIAAIGTMHCKFAAFLFEQHCRWWRLRFLSNFCCNGTWYHCNCSRELQHSLQPLSWAMISLQSLLQPAESLQWSFATCRCIIITLTNRGLLQLFSGAHSIIAITFRDLRYHCDCFWKSPYHCNCFRESWHLCNHYRKLTVHHNHFLRITTLPQLLLRPAESSQLLLRPTWSSWLLFASCGTCEITLASCWFIAIAFCKLRYHCSCSCNLQNHRSHLCNLRHHCSGFVTCVIIEITLW